VDPKDIDTEEETELKPGEQIVEVDEPDDDAEPAEPASASPEERASRRERRAARRDRLVEESSARAEAAERRAAAAEERAHNLAQQAIARPAARDRAPDTEADPLDVERKRIIRDRVAFNRRYQDISARSAKGEATEKEIEELEQEGLDLEDRVQENAVARHMRKNAPQQVDPRVIANQARMRSIAPELDDPRFQRIFKPLWDLEVARAGKDDFPEFEAAVTKARAELGGGPQRRPERTASELSKHTGISRGATSSAPTGARTVVLTKEDKRMANAAYRHIKDEDERYKTFAREVKSKMADE
jgi:hypothetical protein